MTYFLERIFEIDDSGKLVPLKYCKCLIRPTEWDYSTVRQFFSGKLKKDANLVLDGQVAFYYASGYGTVGETGKKFNTAEEWLIALELEEGISPSFEQWIVNIGWHVSKLCTSCIAKTIDLTTKEVLEDRLDATIDKIINARKA